MRSVVDFGHQTSPNSTPFQDISDALQRLRDEDLFALPASAMAEDLEELRRLGNCIDAELNRRLRRFDKGGGYDATPAFSAASWLRWKCNFAPAAACDRVAVARELANLPQATEAFAEGEISYAHAAMIARTAERLGDRMESNAETILVDAAKALDPARLRVVSVHLRHAIDPAGVLEDANKSRELRFLSLSQTLYGASTAASPVVTGRRRGRTATTYGIGSMAVRLCCEISRCCGRHHYRVHEEGWRLAWGADGELIAEPP
jgi:hypothetical protein